LNNNLSSLILQTPYSSILVSLVHDFLILQKIKKEVAPQITGEVKKKKDWHNSLFGGRGRKRGCPKQNLDMRRG
jgi:hypothetical protein